MDDEREAADCLAIAAHAVVVTYKSTYAEPALLSLKEALEAYTKTRKLVINEPTEEDDNATERSTSL